MNSTHKEDLINEFLEAFEGYQSAKQFEFRARDFDWKLGVWNTLGEALRDYHPQLDEKQIAFLAHFASLNGGNAQAERLHLQRASAKLYKIALAMKEEGIPIYQAFMDEVHSNIEDMPTSHCIVFE